MEPPIGEIGDIPTREDMGLTLFKVSNDDSDSASFVLQKIFKIQTRVTKRII